MSKDFNIILISMDAVRPDHLGPYGHETIYTPNLDAIGQEGVIFDGATGTSCLTPIAHASILSGNNPSIHRVRGPFEVMQSPMISEKLKAIGYATAGFVGVGFLSQVCGFAKGYDHFSEPDERKAWGSKDYITGGRTRTCLFGNLWPGEMLGWLDKHKDKPFFLFGHYFECHWGSEKHLLNNGLLEKNHLPEFDYYDAKIEYMDKILFGPLIERLKTYGLWEKTIIVVTADHGENLGEHETTSPFYPQHRTLFECDLKIPLIMKAPGLPQNRHVKGVARSIDIVPTLYDLMGLNDNATDGDSLIDAAHNGTCQNRIAYAEELYAKRGRGSLQAVKSDRYKYMINRSEDSEAFFNLEEDPDETNNLIGSLSESQRVLHGEWRQLCDAHL
jgi:arylsulfatase A-like enzyme